MVDLSTQDSAWCQAAARLGNRQQVSPMRLMSFLQHLDPFISCFQKDISLASEDQRGCQKQRTPVSHPQTNTGSGNMPRSRQAETDRATKDHTLVSVQTLWSGGQGQVNEGVFKACFGHSLFIEESGRGLLFSWGLRQDHTAQIQINDRGPEFSECHKSI